VPIETNCNVRAISLNSLVDEWWCRERLDRANGGLMRVPRSLMTIRRLMILSAGWSLLFACCIHPGVNRPGFYLRVYRVSAGACRNDRLGRYVGRNGKLLGWPYEVGIWAERRGEQLYGLRVRDGQCLFILGDWREFLVL
jgi:hypothetical protein